MVQDNEGGDDVYVPPDVEDSDLLIMLICHSIALGNQLQLEKFLDQLREQSDKEEKEAQNVYITLADLSMSQIKNLSNLTLVPIFA